MINKEDEGFLSRWSRRKANESVEESESQAQHKTDEGKIESESESESDEAILPLWQQKGIGPKHKQKALAALFKQAEFNDVDQMNEYDEDFTNFSRLGDVVTHEMKRMLRLAEEKTQLKLDNIQPNDDTELAQDIQDETMKPDENEGGKRA